MKNLKYLNQQVLMLMSVLGFLFNPVNAAILNALIPLKDAANDLKLMVEAIQLKIANYHKLIKSFAQDKEEARIQLVQTAFPIISSARSYCIKNRKSETAEQLNITLKNLEALSFSALLSKCLLCINLIHPLVSSLTDYNISSSDMDAWRTKYKSLIDLMGAPIIASKKRHDLGVEIHQDMVNIMKFFRNQLTPLVGNFVVSQPAYYSNFHNIKRIIRPNTHHTRLLANVTSELGVPFYEVTVTIDAFTDAEGKTYKAISAVTDASGNAEVSGFFAAPRTVSLSGIGVIKHTFCSHPFY